MQSNSAERMRRVLTETFGHPFSISETAAGEFVVAPNGTDSRGSFEVVCAIQWLSPMATFRLGRFAADLVRGMGTADSDARAALISLMAALSASRLRVVVRANGRPVVSVVDAVWTEQWSEFELSVAGPPLPEAASESERFDVLVLTVVAAVGLVWAIAAESSDSGAASSRVALGFAEGAERERLVKQYERDRRNRAMCIAAHGCRCSACGFDFERAYGPIGTGYIHVHHLLPVSQLGADYVVNPVSELAPLCPNCHAMAHRREPPFTVQELRRLLEAQAP